ncbi:ATP-binding cassette domain-containing protein [Streptomyces bobili]|uniref:ABC transporter permease subunit n=1 Tax=Streptomyces bobili TaxID=67280 RepID=UPI0036539B5D
MTAVLQLAVLGMATGSLYALSALGVLVVHRSSGVLNLANGAFAMVSGYLLYSLHDDLGLPAAVAVVAGIATSCLLSLLVFFAVMRPLSAASTLTRLVATLAVYLVVQSVVQLVYGPFNKVPASFLPVDSVSLGGVTVGSDQLIIVALGVVVTAALSAVYRRTSFGLATTAVSENPRALASLGRSTDTVRAVNWAVAGVLGGLAGVLIAPITQLTPGSFLLFLVPSLAAAVLGGMRSFPITLVAGMLTGAAQVLCARYLDVPGARDAVPFLVIILVLVLRGRSLPGRGFVSEHLPRVGSGRIRIVPVTGVLVLVLVLGYTVFDDSLVIGAIVLAAIALIALSQVVITGYAGQLSLAQMTMAGIGALVAAQVSVEWGVPFPLAVVAGAVAVIPVGIVVGLPALRARGTALAIATLGFGVAVSGMVFNNSDFNGGAVGLSVDTPSFFGIDLNPTLSPRNYLAFAVVVLFLVALLVANLRRGRSGRRLLAIRTNERAAAALGINVTVAKLYAFTVAAVIAALGGILMAFRNPSVLVSSGFDVFSAINTVAFAVLGGIGYVGGALIAGSFHTSALPAVGLGNVLGSFDMQEVVHTWMPLVGGILLLLQLLLRPAGVVDALVHKKNGTSAPEAAGSKEQDPSTPVPGSPAQPDSAATTAAPQEARSVPRELRGARLEVRGATVRYGAVTAVDEVTLTVEPGEVLAVIGPNGAGKTSLMDGITGFAPMRGEVLLGGIRVDTWAPHRRARAGLVRSFQTLELLEDMTVLDNLRAASDPHDLASYVIDLVRPERGTLSPATEAAVRGFHLEGMLDAVPTDLGYGDRRLVAIARAIAGEPAALLLDEPAAGLSEGERDELARLIQMIARDWRIPVLLIEHDVDLVRRVSDRVLALDFGEPVVTGTPDEVLSDPRVVEAYLGGQETQSGTAAHSGTGTLAGDDDSEPDSLDGTSRPAVTS